MKNAKKLKNTYKAPRLKVYGEMEKLTAGGSGSVPEPGNAFNKPAKS